MWYKGLPFPENKIIIDHDAVAIIVGVEVDDFNIGYSYDITVSGLAGYSGGSHEISLQYYLKPILISKRKKPSRADQRPKCPFIMKN